MAGPKWSRDFVAENNPSRCSLAPSIANASKESILATALSSFPSPVHSSPKISLNKLGEYLDASPTRRRSIVKAQKKPPGEIVVARYGDAHAALKEYFAYPTDEFLPSRILELRADLSGSPWARQDRQLSADVLEACVDLVELVHFDGYRAVPCPQKPQAALLIGGTKVSVRPDFLIVRAEDASKIVGAMKFSFNKQHALQHEGCEYVATVLRKYLEETYLDMSCQVESRLCIAIATSSKQVISAPKAYKSRMSAIEAACEEIAGRWATA